MATEDSLGAPRNPWGKVPLGSEIDGAERFPELGQLAGPIEHVRPTDFDFQISGAHVTYPYDGARLHGSLWASAGVDQQRTPATESSKRRSGPGSVGSSTDTPHARTGET
jgi:hypothetical protein